MTLTTRSDDAADYADGDGAPKPYVVIGGGPAGLSAGYLLAKAGKKVIVFEAEDQVGGIAKTVVEIADGKIAMKDL